MLRVFSTSERNFGGKGGEEGGGDGEGGEDGQWFSPVTSCPQCPSGFAKLFSIIITDAMECYRA